MNDLEKYFRENTQRGIAKWTHYFEIYDRHFAKYRNKEVTILEIGVSQGGSLQMWKSYFGGKAKIYGIDINPKCKEFEEENIQVLIGSQEDRKFLREVKTIVPKVDILIDDGGHTMRQQIVTFEELFSHVKEDGTYLCEDLRTSYWLSYGGGLKRRGTFIEYSKNFIDWLNAYHCGQLRVNDFTRTADSIHYYDSVVVVEKHPRHIAPTVEFTGNRGFLVDIKKSAGKRLLILFYRAINGVLRAFRIKGFSWIYKV